MLDILDTLTRWLDCGERVAVATLTATKGSAPRTPGATAAVNASGHIAGSISGGCIESDVYETALACLAGAPPKMLRYGAADADDGGLTCGGTLDVFVHALRVCDVAKIGEIARTISNGEAVTFFTRLDGPQAGAIEIGSDAPEQGDARVRYFAGARTFVRSIPAKPDMFVFGAIDFSRAMASVGRLLGYRVTVVDARPAFATRERIPDADRIVVAWPDEFLATARVDASTVLIVLTHDIKFDGPLLRVALESDAGYIGVMGSRSTHARRLAVLRGDGIREAQIARLHAPIGLDIGAASPQETAISIAAEIIAARNGRRGGALRENTASLHGPVPPRGREALRSA